MSEPLGIVEAMTVVLKQDKEITRLREALRAISGPPDPPATLDEPNTDAEIIRKMRTIARDALAASQERQTP
jgi:hypothetical protein